MTQTMTKIFEASSTFTALRLFYHSGTDVDGLSDPALYSQTSVKSFHFECGQRKTNKKKIIPMLIISFENRIKIRLLLLPIIIMY